MFVLLELRRILFVGHFRLEVEPLRDGMRHFLGRKSADCCALCGWFWPRVEISR